MAFMVDMSSSSRLTSRQHKSDVSSGEEKGIGGTMSREFRSQISQSPTSLRGMIAFVALVDAGSFSAAADRLELTPSG